jgi:hypothetical protein
MGHNYKSHRSYTSYLLTAHGIRPAPKHGRPIRRHALIQGEVFSVVKFILRSLFSEFRVVFRD